MTHRDKPFWDMTTDELADATREFDAPDDIPAVKPSAAMLDKHRAAELKGERLTAHSTRTIQFSADPLLIKSLDQRAKKEGKSRSTLLADLVKSAIAQDRRKAS